MTRPKLPDKPIGFEQVRDPRWARVLGFRPPLEGEWYLSGAVVAAYRAPKDLATPYWIVTPLPVRRSPVVHMHEYPNEENDHEPEDQQA